MFNRLRVLEFGQYIAAPVTGMLLADLGADVIKVEAPGGDPLCHWPAYQTWNRNKRVVRLDLKTEPGLQSARRLIAGADVVIDGYAPGALGRYGLDPSGMVTEHPSVIVCSLPGFADEMGLAGMPAWEPIISAAAGLFRGRINELNDGGAAVFTPLPFASIYAGVLAANSIAAALVARARIGVGQRIDVPIHSALMLAIGFGLQRIRSRTEAVRAGGSPLVDTYRCADGKWVQLHCALPRFVDGFVNTTGLESWWEEGLLDRNRWASDPSVVAEVQRRLAGLFATKTAAEWEEFLSAAGLCCAECRTVEEWLHHPQARQSGLVIEAPTRFGPMLQPGPLVRAPGEEVAARGVQVVSEQDAAWRTPALPLSQPGEPRLEAGSRGALRGIRVLDLCLILAGPTCARTLAEFGADVIKIDAPESSIIEGFWLDTNRGKRSIVLDLKTPEGQEVFWKLVETSDVIVENFRKGVVERLGIGYEQIAARFPRIIYASMNCYGYEGAFADRPGWEQLAQAATGMQVRYGGRDGRPQLARYAVNDYASGLGAALGVLGALHERYRTGRGLRVPAARAATAGILQSWYMFDYPGYVRREVEGQDVLGFSALSRLYRASDDWFYLHCPPSARQQLASLPQFAGIRTLFEAAAEEDAESPLAAALAERFALHSRAYWEDVLGSAGVPAIGATLSSTMLDDPRFRAAGLVTSTDAGYLGAIDHVGIPHRLHTTPAVSGRPTPALGEDTVAVMRELGYADLEIGRLLGRRVISAHGL